MKSKLLKYHRNELIAMGLFVTGGVLGRYESACRDLGIAEEQKNWLLTLLMDEKNKVDAELDAEGGGHI